MICQFSTRKISYEEYNKKYKKDIIYNRDDFVPSGVKLIKGTVTAFDPDNNKVVVDGKEEVSYDHMIVATGLVLNYGGIKGLEGVITSSGADNAVVRQKIGKNGTHSIYFRDGAEDTWKGIQELVAKAKAHTGPEKLQALYSMPATAIKCGGAPMKIMYLTHAHLEKAGVANKGELTFNTAGTALFGIKEYADAITKQFEKRGFKWNFGYNLTDIDTAGKVATFTKTWKEKGEYDEDLEEYTMVTKSQAFPYKYDFIHVTPPMGAPEGLPADGAADLGGDVSDETGADMDSMNADIGGGDEFGASDAAAGGAETAGREMRESRAIARARKLAESHSIMSRLAK
mgnify:CR=1 FL=1